MVESSQFFLAFRHALEVLQVRYSVVLKGLALAMDLAFDDRCSTDIMQKVYLSQLLRVYVGLIMSAPYFCHSR